MLKIVCVIYLHKVLNNIIFLFESLFVKIHSVSVVMNKLPSLPTFSCVKLTLFTRNIAGAINQFNITGENCTA